MKAKHLIQKLVEAESTCTIDPDGDKRWHNSSRKLHRLDGPALEHDDGSKSWWVNGKLHRLDGPAMEHADGSKSWWANGKLHRLDGPAMEYASGFKRWHVDGSRIPVRSQRKFEQWLRDNYEKELLGIKI